MDRATRAHAHRNFSLGLSRLGAFGPRRLIIQAGDVDCRKPLHLSRLWEVRFKTIEIYKLRVEWHLHIDQNRLPKRGTLYAKYASES
jgi:hypothetical protein